MAQGFKSTRKGITASFTPEEAELMIKLFNDVALALEPEQGDDEDPLAALVGIKENTEAPTDPALARMLPVASDDPEVADEFRRYTEINLRQQKIAHLKMAAMDLQTGHLTLDAEHASAWAKALNDVRLTLGARLNITSEADAAQVGEKVDWKQIDSVEDYMAFVYNFVSWVQDTLMEAMLSEIETDR
ncbi:DUF2017 domain-containing protein [Rothia aerolata]|uniref:DUF2017 domain-containing protein n=1 Tax=Rothia aerolata TaxID=1812262 RepID=A0A917MR64_9MICC|nr:DUF2017 domain-containing protein [Rothia aerolata]GGH59061.1 hypothetical protein GCM10007359_05890 [Rothia aerolata]